MRLRAYKLAAACLLLSPLIARADAGRAIAPATDLSPHATAAAFNEYAGGLQRLLGEADVNQQHAWGQIQRGNTHGPREARTGAGTSFKVEQQEVQRRVAAEKVPSNVSEKAATLFSAAHQAASDAASDYVRLAAYFDIGARTGNLSGVGDNMSDTAQALQRDLAAFQEAVTAGRRQLAVR